MSWSSRMAEFRWRIFKWEAGIVLFCFLLTAGIWGWNSVSCWLSKDRVTAEQAVVQFHDEFNSGMYQEIYEMGDDVSRKGQSQNDVFAFLNSVRQRLGQVKTSTRVGCRVNKSQAETVATLQYDTEFTQGKGHEQFIFVLSGGKAALHLYKLTSPLMPSK